MCIKSAVTLKQILPHFSGNIRAGWKDNYSHKITETTATLCSDKQSAIHQTLHTTHPPPHQKGVPFLTYTYNYNK